MLVGELGDGVADPLVEGALGHLAAVQVHDRHAEQDRRGHDVEQLPPVAEHDEDVGPRCLEDSAGRGATSRAPCSSWASTVTTFIGSAKGCDAPPGEAVASGSAARGRRRHT